MGLQIRTYINGNQEYLELYGNEDITIEVSFAEIQDISKKNSAYSKEFRIPGTKNNNYIFNYFFDINTVGLDWNPKRKFEADLLYDGYELYNGYVRMNSVTIDKTEKIYSVTFYSAIGDLAANIGDKALCNVNTTSLNHSLYDTDVVTSIFLDPSLHPIKMFPNEKSNPVTEGDVQYILGYRGYDYTGNTFGTIQDIDVSQTPILEFSGISGFFDYYKTPIPSSYFIPSIRTRKLYELIVNQAGYNIESDFFDTDYFGRYYIPLSFNTEQPYMSQNTSYDYFWFNMSAETEYLTSNVFNFETEELLEYKILKTQEIRYENMGFNPLVNSDYSAVTPSISGITDYLFALPYSNQQDFEFEISITSVFSGTTTCTLNPFTCTGVIGEYRLFKFIELSGSTIIAEPVAVDDYYGTDTFIGSLNTNILTGKTKSDGSISGTDLYFLANKIVNNDFFTFSGGVKILKSPKILPKVIQLNKEMNCEDKQIEFIQNINRQFNLVVVEHPIKPKTLIIEPMVNYIGKGEELDWTSKVDYNSPQTLTPTTSVINGSIYLSNKEDKDFINTEYAKRNNKTYGQNIIDLGVDYKNETINLVQTLGQNTDYYLGTSGDTKIALPCYFISKETNKDGKSVFEYKPFRSKVRNVFKSVPLPTGNTLTNPIFYRYSETSEPFTPVGLISTGTLPNVNRLTTYPFNITGFSHYTVYDSSTKFTDDELVYPDVETQYDRYYRDYIEDLTSEENKIYSCKMYLTPWEVAGLYSNEVIIIKNAKFRINKISNLSLTEPSLCNVELIKLTRDYTPTPTLFYDLIDCDDPNNIIHSNTDINYLLWAFDGKVVELILEIVDGIVTQTGKYSVVKVNENPEYTYENVYFNIDRTVGGTIPNDYDVYWDYKIFDSCETLIPSYILTTNQ